jgi:hypothetical protein
MPMSTHQGVSAKQEVLRRLFEEFQQRQSSVFTNGDVKRIAQQIGFANPFDVTKIDSKDILPDEMRDGHYCIAHIGRGRHPFLQELQHWFHDFEHIDENERIRWRYRKSLLNDLDRGEASVISLVINQHILYDFVYEDVVATPKIYIPGRTRANLTYWVGQTYLKTQGLQMEMDLVLEYQGVVTVFEAKSKQKFPSDFAVYQLFHPAKFYYEKLRQAGLSAKVNACYILKSGGGKRSPLVLVRFYLYEFEDFDRLDSIRLVRKAEYHLQPR